MIPAYRLYTGTDGKTFTVRPGDVLLAVDHTGSGHEWRLINDEHFVPGPDV